MNFTNSPYEPFMKQPSHYRGPVGPELAPKGTRCHGCPYWKGIESVIDPRAGILLLKKPGDKK